MTEQQIDISKMIKSAVFDDIVALDRIIEETENDDYRLKAIATRARIKSDAMANILRAAVSCAVKPPVVESPQSNEIVGEKDEANEQPG